MAVKQCAGNRGFNFFQMGQRPGGHNFSPLLTGAGAQVDDRIRRANGFLIMFHHQDAVAPIPQSFEGIDEDPVIPGMQADCGFIQNVADTGKIGTQLSGQANPLGFSPGQRVTAARQRQIR